MDRQSPELFQFRSISIYIHMLLYKKKNGELGVTVQNNEKKNVQEDTDPVCLVCAVSERKRNDSASSWLILSNILISSAVPYYPILRYI